MLAHQPGRCFFDAWEKKHICLFLSNGFWRYFYQSTAGERHDHWLSDVDGMAVHLQDLFIADYFPTINSLAYGECEQLHQNIIQLIVKHHEQIGLACFTLRQDQKAADRKASSGGYFSNCGLWKKLPSIRSRSPKNHDNRGLEEADIKLDGIEEGVALLGSKKIRDNYGINSEDSESVLVEKEQKPRRCCCLVM